MTAQGEDILAFLDCVLTEQERTLTPLVGVGTCPDWGVCQPECTHQFGINDSEAKLRRVTAERKIVALYRSYTPGAAHSRYADSGDRAMQHERNLPALQTLRPVIQLLAEGYGWPEGER